eukprot:50521_1
MSTEVTVLEERANKLEQMVKGYTTKYKILLSKYESSEELIKQQKLEIIQLKDLCEDYSTKYDEMVSRNELLTFQQQFSHHNQSSTHNTNSSDKESETITQLKKQLETAENTIKTKENLIDQNRQIIDSLNYQSKQSKDTLRFMDERDHLQTEFDNFTEIAQQEIDKMQTKLLMLSEKNSSLQKERNDVIELLEERDYENQMLKTGYGIHPSNMTNKMQNEADTL